MAGSTETDLEYKLTNSYKGDLISYIKVHQDSFPELIELAISNKQPYSWRAAWLLWSCMDNLTVNVKKSIFAMITNLQ